MSVRVPNRYLSALLILFLSHQTFPQTPIRAGQEIYTQFTPPVFQNITIKDGLPENSVTCILQDYLGYLWFGTQNGLVKYDGYSMKVFQPEANNSNSISDRGIVTVYEDKNKTLWIGTLNGLNKFDRANELFKRYRYDANDTSSISGNQIESIYEDKNKGFWVGTTIGLNQFDRDSGIFTRYNIRDGVSSSNNTPNTDRSGLSINAIIQDPESGNLFIGTEMEGLWLFNVKEKKISKYEFSNDNSPDKKIGFIHSFYKARGGKIWMASNNTLSRLDPKKKEYRSYIEFPIMSNERYTRGFNFGSVIEDKNGLVWSGFFAGDKGVFCLNPATGNILQYNLFSEKSKNVNYNIYNLYEDCSGIIWIGTWGTGLMKLDTRKNIFQVLSSNSKNLSNSLSNSSVYSVTNDSNGFIWYSTNTALDKYDIRTGAFKHYLVNEECITKSTYSTLRDKSGYLWLGTNSCGLIRFDPIGESYRFYFNDKSESINLTNKRITRLFQDRFGLLWLGTEGFGLYKYDIGNNKLTNYKNDPNDSSSLSHNVVRAIFEDRSGNLWIGTSLGGLNKFNRKTEKFSFVGLNSVLVIYEDKQGNLWLSDYFLGLTLFDREKGAVIASYNQKDGLASNHIMGIVEDDQNNLWINTEIGLSKFNTKTRTFRNYFPKDGLPDWFPTFSKLYKGPEGRIYFCSLEGLMVFDPGNIKDDPVPPLVVLSNVSLFDRPDEKLNYKGFISELKEITLPYNQNDLRFDYVGLHFGEPTSNKYKYILENFDNEWRDAGSQRNAVYTNLDPGEYVFKVIASNNDGVWNKTGASLKIIINPPIWATTWVYILYTILILSLIYFTWKLQLRRVRNKHELEMSRFEAQKLHEVDELKSRFFTNISHEFRTPLTLILGPVKQMIEELNEGKMKDDLGIVHRNASKLLELVKQLLDISKLESGKMKLQTVPQNIVPLVKALTLSFTSYAERKMITLKFTSSEDEIVVYIDRDKIEKISTNLLSNAFKFTPEGGTIEVTVRADERNSSIIISDTGVGIPREKISKIFDRFYQIDGSHTREQEGTGVGLSLTKELVELHRGKIEVESEEGKGSTFMVSIPLGREHLNPEEIIEEEDAEDIEGEKLKPIYDEENEKKGFHYVELYENESLPVLLIIEDNVDVRNYIKINLNSEYKIVEAVDGEDGWDKSVKNLPDLIVSDVMMPKMDGFKLCEKLKTDERTSHIPVILLTAKAAKEDKLAGYETGADEYIMKPFEPDELMARIKNLIEQRKRIHEHFKRQGVIDFEKSKFTPIDQKFLQKALDIINKNISQPEFGVEAFAESLNVSRSVLHRKIVSLTGESPGDLIRYLRLKKASQLIEGKFGNITEISLEVGFNNPGQFARSFQKQFGVLPSTYSQKFDKNSK